MRYFSRGKEKIVYEDKLEYLRCDCCMKKIEKGNYCRVVTGHHDWGNDSGDSITTKEICLDCIVGFASIYLSNFGGTQYIEIEREYFSPHFESYDKCWNDRLVVNDNDREI